MLTAASASAVWLRDCRAESGLSGRAFAARLGVPPVSLWRWERGSRIPPAALAIIGRTFSLPDHFDRGAPAAYVAALAALPESDLADYCTTILEESDMAAGWAPDTFGSVRS